MASPGEEEISFKLGSFSRRWLIRLFFVFGVYSIIDGLVWLTEGDKPQGHGVEELVLAAPYFLLMSLYWARADVITDRRGLTVRNALSRGRHYAWADVSRFGVQGRFFPAGVAILGNGRVVRLTSLSDGLQFRKQEPSWELRSALAELDKMRVSAVSHPS